MVKKYMIKAIIFDCYGVLWVNDSCNTRLVTYIERHLKSRFACGMLSNASRREIDSLLPREVQEVFDVQILSGEVGYSKPDPAIYTAAVQALDVAFSEAIFIDDRLAFTTAARALGMQTICYEDYDQFREEISFYLDNIKSYERNRGEGDGG